MMFDIPMYIYFAQHAFAVKKLSQEIDLVSGTVGNNRSHPGGLTSGEFLCAKTLFGRGAYSYMHFFYFCFLSFLSFLYLCSIFYTKLFLGQGRPERLRARCPCSNGA